MNDFCNFEWRTNNTLKILVNPDMYVKIIAGIARLDPFLIEAIGRSYLKGIKEPVSLYQVIYIQRPFFGYKIKIIVDSALCPEVPVESIDPETG